MSIGSEEAGRGKLEHRWRTFQASTQAIEACALCGTVRRRDGLNKPCKGPVPITLRADYPAGRAALSAGKE